MSANLHPQSRGDVLEAVRWAVAERAPLEIVGQGSKRSVGHPVEADHMLDLSALSGVTLYEPEELVLSALGGTPLAEIETLLANHDQELQFEPSDLGPLLGIEAGQGTLGGLVNTNLCGPRRLKAGSVRDHVLGIHAVSGRGEEFKSGGRVVKNVTGYDLSKGVTGSWGTLAVLTDITMKVLPRAETEQTLVLNGLSDAEAAEAMAMAIGSNAEVSGAAHLPTDVAEGGAKTLLRLEGFVPSVKYRIDNLANLLARFGPAEKWDTATSRKQWLSIRDCHPFVGRSGPVWRLSCAPSNGHRIAAGIGNRVSAKYYYDWQGGLIWLLMEDGETNGAIVRSTLAELGGGHATLIRADASERRSVPVFQPQAPARAALNNRYRENFDPHIILNPGRMGG